LKQSKRIDPAGRLVYSGSTTGPNFECNRPQQILNVTDPNADIKIYIIFKKYILKEI
jgi:hypothetical protein